MNFLWLAAAAAVAAGVCYIRIFNKLRQLSVKIDEGSAGIDVALEKRYDLLSEELEAVKKYLQHEQDVYMGVTAIRKGSELDKATFQEKKELSKEAAEAIQKAIDEQQKIMRDIKIQLDKMDAAEENSTQSGSSMIGLHMNLNQKLNMLASVHQGLTGVTSAINALSEHYPTLYSSSSMIHFQRDIFDVEEHLQAARRLYNSNVSLYNQRIAAFPHLIVAKIHGMKEAPFYAVEEKKRSFDIRF